MAKRSPSPTDEDFNRIAEAIYNLDVQGKIQDRDSYEQAYSEYFEDVPAWKKDKKRSQEVLHKYMRLNKISDRHLFKESKGKSLVLDRQKTSKETVYTEEEYIKRGSQNVDLVGYDTPTKRRVFNIPARSKGRIVYASKEFVSYKGKRREIYRDKRGRFASIKK